MLDFNKLNSNQIKLISEWRAMGLSTEEIEIRFYALNDSEDIKGRSIDIEEAQKIIDHIKLNKNLFKSVVLMVIVALISILVVGPLISIISMSIRLMIIFIVITPIIIAVVGKMTYHKSSYIHRGIGALISFSWIFFAFFVYHMFSYGLSDGFRNMFHLLTNNFKEMLEISFKNSYGNEWILGVGIVMSALTFMFCEGEIAVHEMNKWSIDNGLGPIEVDGVIKKRLDIE